MKIFFYIKQILFSFIEYFITNIPGIPGRKIRYVYYRLRLKKLGKNVVIDTGVRMTNPEHISIGDNTWIDHYVVLIAGSPNLKVRKHKYIPNDDYLYGMGELVIGKNCHIAPYCVFQAHGGIQIGDNCGFASNAKIYSMSHHYKNLNDSNDKKLYVYSPMVSNDDQFMLVSPVVLQNNTGIALGSVVLPGTTIKAGTWIGAMSLANGYYPENIIAVGIPAKIKKKRLE